MFKQLHFKSWMLALIFIIGGGNLTVSAQDVLFHETFGNNSGSARDWNDSYSVKSGIAEVYSGVTSYTVSNVKQGKNTTGSTQSGLNQSSQGTDAYIIIGPLNVSNYESLSLTYQWKAASIKGTYSTHAYYATSANGTYTEVTGTGNGATTFVLRSYSLPVEAQVSTLYLKIVFNTSNTQAIIDEVDLKGTSVSGSVTVPNLSVTPATTENFTYELGNGPSEEQIVTIAGSNLTDDINVSVTGDFEITDNANYSNSLTLSESENLVSVRMKSGLAIGEYTGALTISSEGAENVVVNLTGEVTAVVLPSIVPESFEIDAEAGEDFGTINVTYTKVDASDAVLQFFDANGNSVQASTYDWLTAEIETDGSLSYMVDANTGEARSAYMKIYGLSNANDVYSEMITLTQAAYVAPADYATLPFNWEGGASADLTGMTGVTVNGLGSDYANSHNPYLVKFDGTGDYIQVKTNEQIGYVTIRVKMIGGASASSIIVKGSTDGETFTTVETLSISGKQNEVLTLATQNNFAATDRFVRLEFVKGSNVGVGPITITGCISTTVTAAGLATFVPQYSVSVPEGVQAMIVTTINETSVTTSDVTTIPAGAPVVLKNAGTFGFPVTNYNATASNINGNQLKVVTATEPAPAGSYVLYNGEEGVGFYEWTGPTLAVGRVYLAPAVGGSVGGSRSFLSIGGNGSTGIEAVVTEQQGECYDLQGRRVAQPQKGLYIVNGKKVIK